MKVAHTPTVTAEQMREIDRVAVEEFGLPILSMMENAGRGLATLAGLMLGDPVRAKILVVAGKGGNGGGGLAAVRYLVGWGARVTAFALESAGRTPTGVQAHILRASGIEVRPARDVVRLRSESFDLALDAVLGYGARGEPVGHAARLIGAANRARRVLALDLPSGLAPDTGRPGTPCTRAEATLTLALPKKGLLRPEAAPYVGELWLGDLGIPPAVYERLGMRVPRLFRAGEIVRRLTPEGRRTLRRTPRPPRRGSSVLSRSR